MAHLQEDGYIKYGPAELQSTPSFGSRDAGYGGVGLLNPHDPAQSLGLLPGQTLSRRLFPDPLASKKDEMVEIARRLMGSREQKDL